MKKITIVIIIILLCYRINAQFLFSGTVYDKATNQPITDVYVSFNRTTANAITDNSGKFELTVTQRLNTQLVFSHIAYNMVIIENPFEEFSGEIYMEQRLNILGEVTIQTDPFTREQKLIAFRKQFLGETPAGKSCKIMNENDVQLWYNVETNTLSASSDQPIVVINEYLGYQISFILLDFKVEYTIARQNSVNENNIFYTTHPHTLVDVFRQNSYSPLNSNNARLSYFAVISSFTNLSQNDARIKRRRDEVYNRSSTFFFKNLVNNTLNDVGFEISIYKATINPCWYTTQDTLSLKMVRLIPADTELTIRVLYQRGKSDITFNTSTLLVDCYGNIDKFDKVVFTGLMGQSRAGNMLPFDYEP